MFDLWVEMISEIKWITVTVVSHSFRIWEVFPLWGWECAYDWYVVSTVVCFAVRFSFRKLFRNESLQGSYVRQYYEALCALQKSWDCWSWDDAWLFHRQAYYPLGPFFSFSFLILFSLCAIPFHSSPFFSIPFHPISSHFTLDVEREVSVVVEVCVGVGCGPFPSCPSCPSCPSRRKTRRKRRVGHWGWCCFSA